MGFFKIGLKKKKSQQLSFIGDLLCARHCAGHFIKVLLCEEKNSLVVCFDAGALRVTEYFFHSG